MPGLRRSQCNPLPRDGLRAAFRINSFAGLPVVTSLCTQSLHSLGQTSAFQILNRSVCITRSIVSKKNSHAVLSLDTATAHARRTNSFKRLAQFDFLFQKDSESRGGARLDGRARCGRRLRRSASDLKVSTTNVKTSSLPVSGAANRSTEVRFPRF